MKEDMSKSRSVVISVNKPTYKLIECGRKTVEIRKTSPKIQTPFTVYIYETKSGNGIGKVVGSFICEKTEEVDLAPFYLHKQLTLQIEELSCTTQAKITRYTRNKPFWVWHITNVIKFDQPQDLQEFHLKRPPGSWCYTSCDI